jgi:hypothetical protein
MRMIKAGGGCRDDIETDGGAGGCTPRAGKVGLRRNPGPYFFLSLVIQDRLRGLVVPSKVALVSSRQRTDGARC